MRTQDFNKILKNSFIAAVECHAEISSTNDRAIECARLEATKLPLLIVAQRQTAGRGRGGNCWWTGEGSLAFTLLVGPELVVAEQAPSDGANRYGLAALAVGVAVIDALSPLTVGHEIGISWPNDVMLDGRKLCGVLIEALPGGKLAIGVGINTNNTAADAPQEVRARVATLRDATGRQYDSAELLLSIVREIERWLGELLRQPESIVARMGELCLQRGKRLQVIQGDRQIEGLCLGIAADGALLLEVAGESGQPVKVFSGVIKGDGC